LFKFNVYDYLFLLLVMTMMLWWWIHQSKWPGWWNTTWHCWKDLGLWLHKSWLSGRQEAFRHQQRISHTRWSLWRADEQPCNRQNAWV